MKIKRGMLAASIVVASIMFAVLFAAVAVFTGAEKSAWRFVEESGNNRYLVMVRPYIPYEKISVKLNPTLTEMEAIRKFEKQYYELLRNKYASLGLKYDEKTEVSALEPMSYFEESTPVEERFQVNWNSPVIEAYEKKKTQDFFNEATNKFGDLKKLGAKYEATGYYRVDQPTGLLMIPNLRLIQNGKEDFNDKEVRGWIGTASGDVNAIHNGQYLFSDDQVLEKFIVNSDVKELTGIPVVVSAQEAASLFGPEMGIGEEPKTIEELKNWLKDVKEKMIGKTYQVCYRNAVEQSLLMKIQRDFMEAERNKDNNEYRAPNLLYGYPTEACGDIVLKADKRTDLERKQDAESVEIQKKLGVYDAPMHKKLTFQIVGIRNVQPPEVQKNINDYVKNLLSPQNNYTGAEIPRQLYNKIPEELKFDEITKMDDDTKRMSDEFASRILALNSIDDAKGLLAETCDQNQDKCDRGFVAMPYGSNYLLVDEIGKMFGKIAGIAFPVATVLAIIIIWFTISRMMLESRKEIAVYRAMGAKRRDIVVVYLIYAIFVAFYIFVLAFVLGMITALIINHFYGVALTDLAITTFSVMNEVPRVNLFDLSSPLILVIGGLIFVLGILASLQPIIHNIKRSPIDDLRNE